ncbi:hypothetical protein [Actinoplanes sp. NBRC 103695]|uniref:LysM peptidoglycan-binding domain-containing protein n=1 Tax=Actinoplanes sp. NBRC 103695 TaxID=3032202 RepID=UPI0025525FFA|nr:hypothetical protein [Actinoplanes sp. NBRC 103695]
MLTISPRRVLRGAAVLMAALLIAMTTGPAPAVAQRDDPKWYKVQPAYNGQPEFLYEIAERFLGDGDRHAEIFELNKGRVQADGKTVSDPAVIEPGWILVLPDDAEGDGVETGPIPSAPAAPPAANDPAFTAPATSPAAAAPAADKGFPVLLVGLIVLGVLIVTAAVFFLLRRRRSAPSATAAATATSPSRSFDTAAAWTIDRALRVLVTTAATAGRPVPAIYGVSLDESRIVLRLAAPDGDPVEPWEATDNGRNWVAALRDLQALPAAGEVPSPCPRLVTLGTAGGTRELIDLGQSTGVISVGGDNPASRDVVGAWAEELISSPWSDRVQVVTGDVRTRVGGDRLTAVGGIRDALAAAEGEQTDNAYALRGVHRPGDAGALGVLILGSAPGTRDMERVQALVNRPDAAWVVIVLGQTRQDRWRFTAHPDGRLDTGALGITVYTRAEHAPSAR